MVDYCKELVSALETVLPTHYELALTSKTKTPCISYQERNNYVSTNGDTRGYSVISFTVKVWANNIADIMKYAAEVDSVLRSIGFKRVSSNELYDINSTMIQKILTYEALALEEFVGG
jgi:hypothetical protein